MFWILCQSLCEEWFLFSAFVVGGRLSLFLYRDFFVFFVVCTCSPFTTGGLLSTRISFVDEKASFSFLGLLFMGFETFLKSFSVILIFFCIPFLSESGTRLFLPGSADFSPSLGFLVSGCSWWGNPYSISSPWISSFVWFRLAKVHSFSLETHFPWLLLKILLLHPHRWLTALLLCYCSCRCPLRDWWLLIPVPKFLKTFSSWIDLHLHFEHIFCFFSDWEETVVWFVSLCLRYWIRPCSLICHVADFPLLVPFKISRIHGLYCIFTWSKCQYCSVFGGH